MLKLYIYRETFKSYYKILHVLSFVRRFIFNCLKKQKRFVSIGTCDVNEAEIIIVGAFQKPLFSKELIDFSSANLNLFIYDEGILRVVGRLEKATVLFNHKISCYPS